MWPMFGIICLFIYGFSSASKRFKNLKGIEKDFKKNNTWKKVRILIENSGK